jgi:hypothetical protein
MQARTMRRAACTVGATAMAVGCGDSRSRRATSKDGEGGIGSIGFVGSDVPDAGSHQLDGETVEIAAQPGETPDDPIVFEAIELGAGRNLSTSLFGVSWRESTGDASSVWYARYSAEQMNPLDPLTLGMATQSRPALAASSQWVFFNVALKDLTGIPSDSAGAESPKPLVRVSTIFAGEASAVGDKYEPIVVEDPAPHPDGEMVVATYRSVKPAGSTSTSDLRQLRQWTLQEDGEWQTALLTQSALGEVGNGPSYQPDIDIGGNLVFLSQATNLVNPESAESLSKPHALYYHASSTSFQKLSDPAFGEVFHAEIAGSGRCAVYTQCSDDSCAKEGAPSPVRPVFRSIKPDTGTLGERVAMGDGDTTTSVGVSWNCAIAAYMDIDRGLAIVRLNGEEPTTTYVQVAHAKITEAYPAISELLFRDRESSEGDAFRMLFVAPIPKVDDEGWVEVKPRVFHVDLQDALK